MSRRLVVHCGNVYTPFSCHSTDQPIWSKTTGWALVRHCTIYIHCKTRKVHVQEFFASVSYSRKYNDPKLLNDFVQPIPYKLQVVKNAIICLQITHVFIICRLKLALLWSWLSYRNNITYAAIPKPESLKWENQSFHSHHRIKKNTFSINGCVVSIVRLVWPITIYKNIKR
jgi:hypothetical protein